MLSFYKNDINWYKLFLLIDICELVKNDKYYIFCLFKYIIKVKVIIRFIVVLFERFVR